MQGYASGGLDVTLKVAVAALALARVKYSLDRRCPQQSLNPLGKRPLDHIASRFRRRRRSSSLIIFMRGGSKKKVAGTLQKCERLRAAISTL